jgi:hypothetical protein
MGLTRDAVAGQAGRRDSPRVHGFDRGQTARLRLKDIVQTEGVREPLPLHAGWLQPPYWIGWYRMPRLRLRSRPEVSSAGAW